LMQKFKSGHPCSTKDNMALVGILSTEILIDRFIRRREDNLANSGSPGALSAAVQLSGAAAS
jgi:hypothetical protein